MTLYDRAFYDVIRAGTRASAAAVVPILMDRLWPDGSHRERSIVDVGCGEGWWASAFATSGFTASGTDSGDIPATMLAPGFEFHFRDLSARGWSQGLLGHGAALCLEVAEHVPDRALPQFFDELCALSDLIVFSGAVPGQGGHGHVSEKPQSVWAGILRARGYEVSGALRWDFWDHPDVENWYKSNLLVAARCPDTVDVEFDAPWAQPIDVIHPVLFDARRTR